MKDGVLESGLLISGISVTEGACSDIFPDDVVNSSSFGVTGISSEVVLELVSVVSGRSLTSVDKGGRYVEPFIGDSSVDGEPDFVSLVAVVLSPKGSTVCALEPVGSDAVSVENA